MPQDAQAIGKETPPFPRKYLNSQHPANILSVYISELNYCNKICFYIFESLILTFIFPTRFRVILMKLENCSFLVIYIR